MAAVNSFASPNLPLTEYRFTFQAQSPLDASQLTGSLWHGVFGKALRDLVCLVPEASCDSCMFLHQCDYPFLFQGARPLDSTIMSKYQSIPVPHVFRTPQFTRAAESARQIHLTMVLIGNAAEKTELCIKAMMRAGNHGVGKARTQLTLKQVIQKKSTIPELIFAENTFFPHHPAQAPAIPPMPDSIQLQFVTPYRSGKNNTTLDSVHLLMQIIRRISLLQNFYTTQALEADFKELKSQAQKARIKVRMQQTQDKRYSAKHRRTIDTSGLTGNISIQLSDILELWPYLYLGQWLNVGKNASLGYGRYEIIAQQTSLPTQNLNATTDKII